MFGLDAWIAGLGGGHPLLLATVIAVLLGLRHATDPDHVTAVTTLVAGEREGRARHALRLGFSWGLGHATTLLVFGLPIVLAGSYLPERVQEIAEASVGILIIALALRLLHRWRRDRLHLHEHDHGGGRHSHVHVHGNASSHAHHPPRTRTALGAYGIGLVHGMGGSAGVGVLLLAGIQDKPLAVVALVVFAGCTALSMAACSAAFGAGLSTSAARRRLHRLAPTLGFASAAFGAWYL